MNKPKKQLVLIFSLSPFVIGLTLYCLYGLFILSKLVLIQGTEGLGELFTRVLIILSPSAIKTFLFFILPSTIFAFVFINNLHKEPIRQNVICGLVMLFTFFLPLAIFTFYLFFERSYQHGPGETAGFILVCFATIIIPVFYGLAAFIVSFFLNQFYFKKIRNMP